MLAGVPFVEEEDIPFEVTNPERRTRAGAAGDTGAVAMMPIKASATR